MSAAIRMGSPARARARLALLPPCLLAGLLAGLVLGASCSAPEIQPTSPVDEEFARLEAGARNAHSRGEIAYADELYQDLLVEAERSDDPSKIGDCAYNLGACKLALGELAAARELFSLAEHELERAGAPLAQVFIARAHLEQFAGRPAESRAAASATLEDERSRPSARERSEAHVLLGLAALEAGDLERAAAQLEEARAATQEPAAEPARLRLLARWELASGRPLEAARAFDAEAESARELSRYEALAQALEDAGDAWLAAGQAPEARERWLRSARSRFARAVRRGSTPEVELRELAAATRLCARLDDEAVLEEDANLRARLRNLVERIEAERAHLEGLVSLIEAERQARALVESETESGGEASERD